MSKKYFPYALLLVCLASAALRLYGIRDWPFYQDEIYTLDEWRSFLSGWPNAASSQTARLAFVIPLSYTVMNIGYVLFGISEGGSRALMALLGVANILLALYILNKSFNFGTALFAAVLLALWPEHIYYSQYNRFYMVAAFFASLGMLAGSIALERRSFPSLVVACLAGLAAVLCHTLLILVCGWLLFILPGMKILSGSRICGRAIACLTGTAIACAGYMLYARSLVAGWNRSAVWGASPSYSVMTSIYKIGWPVFLLAGLGFVMGALRRDRRVAYWSSWALLWFLVSAVLPMVIVYHSPYTFPFSLAIFVLAGYATNEIFLLLQDSRAISWTWVALVCGLNLPNLVSHYQDGSRHDLRQAANYISRHWHDGDRIAAEASETLRHYAPQLPRPLHLSETQALPKIRQVYGEAGTSGDRLWLVITSKRPGKPADLSRWLYEHCNLEHTAKKPRFDYYDYCVEVFLAPRPGHVEPSRKIENVP